MIILAWNSIIFRKQFPALKKLCCFIQGFSLLAKHTFQNNGHAGIRVTLLFCTHPPIQPSFHAPIHPPFHLYIHSSINVPNHPTIHPCIHLPILPFTIISTSPAIHLTGIQSSRNPRIHVLCCLNPVKLQGCVSEKI